MAGSTTMSFPDFDPVTGQPTIDGWTGNEDPGVATTMAEPGFAVADRVTFSGGMLYPPVVFQCERVVDPAGYTAGVYLALAFFCSLDVTFDSEDVIVIDVIPEVTAAGLTSARRVSIRPNSQDVGAGDPSDLSEQPLAGAPAGADYHARLDRDPVGMGFWVYDSATAKLVGAQHGFANVHAKAASWRPAVSDVTNSGSTSQTMPSGTTFNFSVVSTAGFNPAGSAFVVDALVPGGSGTEAVTVTYTGITGNVFNGCTRWGSGTLTAPASSPVRHSEVGWSVEVLLPTWVDESGDDWIALDDGFGLYLNLCRFGTTADSGSTPHGGFYSTQYVFHGPSPAPAADFFLKSTTWETTPVPLGWYGTGRIPADQIPPGSNLGLGVRFQNTTDPAASVGVRGVNTPGAPLADLIEGPGAPAGTQNYLVAQIENTDPGNPANAVNAEFRFANWGLPPGEFAAWNQPPGIAAVSNPINLAAATPTATTGEIVDSWPPSQVTITPDPGTTTKHLCVWVELNSANAINFVEGGVRRNMNFEHLSTLERNAEISGKGYGPPGSGTHHEFLLVPHTRQVLAPRSRPEAGAQVAKVTWIWFVEGLRRTGETITIDGRTAEIVDPTPGEFGLVLDHDVAGDVLTHELSGGGIRRGPGAAFTLAVPQDGSVTITTRLKAAPAAKHSGGGSGKGWLAFLLALLRRLLRWIKRLFS